jgi:glycosyltransferase involved in cell wall biosynthesis
VISIIIPWRDRKTIATTSALNDRFFQNNEIVVVNYGGNKEDIYSFFFDGGAGDVKMIHIEDEDEFNKSMALNIGLWQATQDFVLILDEDIRLCSFDWDKALDLIKNGHVVTLGYVVDELGNFPKWGGGLSVLRHHVELEFGDGSSVSVETSALNNNNFSRSCPGILMGKREWFLKVSGYNSDLRGWGWEDIDILVRLGKQGFARKELGWGWHLWDDDIPVLSSDKMASESINRTIALTNYSKGNFKGTYERDVERCGGSVD